MGRGENEDTFRTAFIDLWPVARRAAARLVGDGAPADDIAAEALARAFARWPRLDGSPHRDAWVVRTAVNLAIDTVRRRPRFAPAPARRSAEDAVETRLALVAALRALPARQREVVVLRYLTDHSEAEVAQMLGLAPGTVRSHMQRGLEALRRRLGDGFADEEADLAR
jgi:RNA polymerase sigma-70 factor (sigma-E family)